MKFGAMDSQRMKQILVMGLFLVLCFMIYKKLKTSFTNVMKKEMRCKAGFVYDKKTNSCVKKKNLILAK